MKKLLLSIILAVIMLAAISCNRDMCPGSVSNAGQHSAVCSK